MGKMFAVVNFCGNLFLRIARKIAKILDPAKILCHMVTIFLK